MYQPNPPKRKTPSKTLSSSAKNKADKATYAAESRSSAERANVGAGRKRMRDINAQSAKMRAEYMSKQAGKGRVGVKGGFGMTPGTAAGKAEAARRAAVRKDQAAEKSRANTAKNRNKIGGGFGASVMPKYPTPSDRAGSKANIVRAAERNRAGQRASAAAASKAAAKATATRKAAGAAKGAKIAGTMDKRAASWKGADVRAANNTIRRAQRSTYPKGKTLPETR
jgi:hypothetical protein